MKKIWILFLVVGAILAGGVAHRLMARPGRGDAAPPFELPSRDGSMVSLESFRGRPLLVHFWAASCGICRREFPAFARFAGDFSAEEGLAVVAISEDEHGDDHRAVRAFLDSVPEGDYAVLFDERGEVAHAYVSLGVPDSLLVDEGGIIVWRLSGPADWDDHDVRSELRVLIRRTKG